MLRRRDDAAHGALDSTRDVDGSGPVWTAHRLADWIARRRLIVMAVGLAAIVLIATGVTRLTLSGDYEVYFDDANPRLEALNRLYDVFSRNDNLLFVVEPVDGTIFAPDALSLVHAMTQAAWQLPYATRVDSIVNFQRIESRGDEIVIENLVPPELRRGDADMNAVSARVLGERSLLGRLINPQASATGINVQLELTGNRRLAVLDAARAARALAQRFESKHSNVSVHVSGNVMLNAAFPEASIADLKVLTPLMYLTMFVVTGILLRSVKAALLTMLVVISACAVAMGFAGWAGFAITSALVTAPTIITTVAVAGCVHFLSTVQRGRAQGMRLDEAVGFSLHTNVRAMTVTAATTFVGFASLNFSDAPPFRDLGTVSAVGVLAALAMTVLLLPGVMLWIGCAAREPKPPIFDLSAFAARVWRVRVAACAIVLGAMVLFVGVIPRMSLNDAFVEYFDRSVEFRRDTDRIMQTLTGIYQLEYIVDAPEGPFGVHEPAYLQSLAAFVDWLESQPEVTHVNSLVDVMRRLNEHVGNAGRVLPPTREAAAQYLLLYENSLPYGLDLNTRLNVDRSSSRITATLENLDNVALKALESRAQQWLAGNAASGIRATATGTALMFAYIAERNIDAMIRGGALAALVIALALAIVFTSWRVGALSLLPNMAPAVIAFGLWAVIVGEMGIALAIVAAMTLGIVVDDTVHFVSHFLNARRRYGASAEQATMHAFATTGSALVTTSVILMLGFAVLSFSSFQVNHGMGQLASLVIGCALAADFLMLPGLLSFACRRGWI